MRGRLFFQRIFRASLVQELQKQRFSLEDDLPSKLHLTRRTLNGVDHAKAASEGGVWVAIVSPVGNVESLGTELQFGFRGERKVLGQARVEFVKGKASDAVSGRITKRRIGRRSGIGA